MRLFLMVGVITLSFALMGLCEDGVTDNFDLQVKA